MKNGKKTVKVATTNTRGYLCQLFDHKFDNLSFEYEKNDVYEIPGTWRSLLAKTVKMKVLDYVGVFRVVKCADNKSADALFSYNRFLKCNKPYYILLENPSALVNYCWSRPKHYITKKRLKKCFCDDNLKGIICISEACYSTMKNLYDLPDELRIYQIYPLLRDDMTYTKKEVKSKANERVIECLFVGANFRAKGGRELVQVIKNLNEKYKKTVKYSIITNLASVDEEDKSYLNECDNVEIHDFTLTTEELNEYYKKSSVLFNLTKTDSFNLVNLEAIKYGCAVIAADVYAIREMVKDGENGYLTESSFPVWNADGTYNEYYTKKFSSTVGSGEIDKKQVEWASEKLERMINDRELLEMFCESSFSMAREGAFSEKKISEKWEDIINGVS